MHITSSHIPASVLKEKYLENLLSTREIAQEFSCSKTRIRDLLLKHNIPLRKRSERHGTRLAYGKRRISNKIVDHKGELRTVATIKQMYGEGISPNAIARFLNTMKLPTKQQERESDRQVSISEANGKSWHGNTIIKILKREGVYVTRQKGRVALSA